MSSIQSFKLIVVISWITLASCDLDYVREFETIEDLADFEISKAGLQAGEVAWVSGYCEKNDGGGGHFWLDLNNPSLQPNGVTTFAANGGSGADYWRRFVFDGLLSPEMAGSECTFKKDQESLIAAAEEAETLLLSRDYRLDESVTLPARLTLKFREGARLSVCDPLFDSGCQPGAVLVIESAIQASSPAILGASVNREIRYHRNPEENEIYAEEVPFDINVRFGPEFAQEIRAEWFGNPYEDIGEPINKAYLAAFLGGATAKIALPEGRLKMKTPVQFAPRKRSDPHDGAVGSVSLRGQGASLYPFGVPWGGNAKILDPQELLKGQDAGSRGDANPGNGTLIDARHLASLSDAIKIYEPDLQYACGDEPVCQNAKKFDCPAELQCPGQCCLLPEGDFDVSLEAFHVLYPRNDGIRIENEGALKYVNQVYVSGAKRHGWYIYAPYGGNIAQAGAQYCNRSGLVAEGFRASLIGAFTARFNGRQATMPLYSGETIPSVELKDSQGSMIGHLHIESNYSAALRVSDSEGLTISSLYLENNNSAQKGTFDVKFTTTGSNRFNGVSVLAVNDNPIYPTQGWELDCFKDWVKRKSSFDIRGRLPTLLKVVGPCQADLGKVILNQLDLKSAGRKDEAAHLEVSEMVQEIFYPTGPDHRVTMSVRSDNARSKIRKEFNPTVSESKYVVQGWERYVEVDGSSLPLDDPPTKKIVFVVLPVPMEYSPVRVRVIRSDARTDVTVEVEYGTQTVALTSQHEYVELESLPMGGGYLVSHP